MLGALTKAEAKNLYVAQERTRAVVTALVESVETELIAHSEGAIGGRVSKIRRLYDEAVSLCNESVSFFTTFAEEQQNQWDEKSERWQDSDRGQQVSSWIDELNTIAGFEFAPFELDEREIGYVSFEEDDEGSSGMPKAFPVKVDLSYAVYTGDLVEFVRALEDLSTTASDI